VATSGQREDLVRILLLVHGLDVGGAESMIAHLARHLRASGDDLEIGCLGALGTIGEELRADGLSVVMYPRRPGFDLTLPWRLAARARAGRFDVVHTHQRTALFYGLLAGLLHAVPIVYTEHGPWVGPGPRAGQRLFNRLLGRRACRITAVSDDAARRLKEIEGFAGRDITVIRNGVDGGAWAAAARDGRASARARVGLPSQAVILGSVGRLHAVKNHQMLIEVIAELRRRVPAAALVLVGDGPERAALAALAQERGVADAVRFLGWRRDVDRILPAFDLFCLSSLSEGIPLTLLEAMAARVPIVAMAAGGVPEAVRHDVEALLIDGVTAAGAGRSTTEAAAAQRFATAVERLLGDAALRDRLTERAAARVRDEFNLAAACERYRDLLAGARG
jgi:glycosyltransferase involved in cell wall biosynthesis